ADVVEHDAQSASAAQMQRTEEEVSKRQRELREREGEVERYRNESERQRAELVNAAKTEARELLAKANADATRELQEAETRGARRRARTASELSTLARRARSALRPRGGLHRGRRGRHGRRKLSVAGDPRDDAACVGVGCAGRMGHLAQAADARLGAFVRSADA